MHKASYHVLGILPWGMTQKFGQGCTPRKRTQFSAFAKAAYETILIYGTHECENWFILSPCSCLDAPHLIPTGLVCCAALLTVTSDDKGIG